METQKGVLVKEASEFLEDLSFKPALLLGLQNKNYFAIKEPDKSEQDYGPFPPSLIQRNMIEPFLHGKDVQAESTPGRILAAIIPAVQLADENIKESQVLIITPQRTLCHQYLHMIAEITKDMSIKSGQTMNEFTVPQTRKGLEEKPQIFIGAPGRTLDFVKRGFLNLRGLRLLILDGIDHLLGWGFEDQVQQILKFVPMDVQMEVFSSETSSEVERFVEDCLREPVKVVQSEKYVDMGDVEHLKVSVKEVKEKQEFLVRLYSEIENRHSVIYCTKAENRRELRKLLAEKGFNVAGIDSSMTQSERCKVIREFLGSLDGILVIADSYIFDETGCTPSSIPLIIYYDPPLSKKRYQKNFGILKSFSQKQIAINLVMLNDLKSLEEIESFYSIQMKDISDDVKITN